MKIDSKHPLAARATSAAKKPAIDWAKALEAEGRSIERSEARQAPLFTPLDALPSVVGSRAVVVAFRAPYPPSVNRLIGVRVMKVRGKPTAVVYKTREHEDYVQAMGNAVRVATLRNPLMDALPFAGSVVLTARLYRPQKRGDIDNPLKGLFDSLNGVAWLDDSQVVELHVFRHDDKEDPRVELTLEGVPS